MRDRLAPPLAVHRAGESAVLAEYPGIEEVLAATAAVRASLADSGRPRSDR